MAQWYTGCYKNACFIYIDEKSIEYETMTEENIKIVPKSLPKLKVINTPVLFQVTNRRGEKWKTNGASKLLGLSVLLDPTSNDIINSQCFRICIKLTKNFIV